jgi:hypothetical protein
MPDILPHYISPHGMILRCILIVGLVNHQVEQVAWKPVENIITFHIRIYISNKTITFENCFADFFTKYAQPYI